MLFFIYRSKRILGVEIPNIISHENVTGKLVYAALNKNVFNYLITPALQAPSFLQTRSFNGKLFHKVGQPQQTQLYE